MEANVWRKCLAVPEDQRIEHDRPMPGGAQLANAVAADVPGTAGDENVHGYFETNWRGLCCAQGTVG
jgi:hypothetical protein